MMLTADYNILDYSSRFNLLTQNYIIDNNDETEELENSYLCLDFPKIGLKKKNKFFDIIREIEKFSLLPNNWDGYNALPLSESVAEKSKSVIENIDFDFYEGYDIEVKLTPYSTVVIDWFKDNNELSLEIGKDFLGYYCEGNILKEVDKLDISSQEHITKAINQLEEDLTQIL